MNNVKNERVKVYVMIGTLLILLMMFSGITYAFFTAINNNGSTSIVEVTGGKMTISYTGGTSDLLTSKNVIPSNDIIVNKTFTLTGTNTTSGLSMPYKVGLDYVSEFSDGMIHYYIKRTNTNGNITSNLVGTANQTIPGNTSETGYTHGTLKKGNRYLELVTGEFKTNTTNQTITFNLKLQFPDNNENQDSEKGKSLTGKIAINYNESATDTLIAKFDSETKTNEVSTSGLFIDNTSDVNLRYTGANPNNYVEFANTGELWRIIGVFNVKDSTGKIERKIKLVRNESLGSYSWDATGNNDYGFNNWTEADLKNELNGDYLNTALTANKNNWYNSYYDNKPVLRQTGEFNYTNVIKSNYQNMISESVWNLGGNSYNNPSSAPYGLPLLDQYNKERGTITYQNSRPTTWTGKVGLIYASDYGYASTNSECRENLRAGVVYDKAKEQNDYTNTKCKLDNWLQKSSWYWTLSPCFGTSLTVFRVSGDGAVDGSGTFNSLWVWPAVFLKSDILIASGTGEKTNPFRFK